jgi:1,2-phenylacetyl-CoA epoxidase PaaB subunit
MRDQMTKMLDTGARYSNADVWFVKSSQMNSMISSTKEVTSQNDGEFNHRYCAVLRNARSPRGARFLLPLDP